MKLSTAKSLMKFWKNAKSEVEKMKIDGTIKLSQIQERLKKGDKKES